ncbi:hypothetical protein [Chitinivibrio alkaliphilus]|nr:hypothetical protein [Chitinivibrio alkaliphilus]
MKLFLAPDEEFLKVDYKGIQKKAFQSTVREVSSLTIIYKKDTKVRKKEVFLKTGGDQYETYSAYTSLYENMAGTTAQKSMPRFYAYDKTTNTLYMEYLRGTPAKYGVLKNACFPFVGNSKEGSFFEELGVWLRTFHDKNKTAETVGIQQLASYALTALEFTENFTAQEKAVVRTSIQAFREKYKQANFSKVQNHNDFTLRNILKGKNRFYIIDWDATQHPLFDTYAPIWNDITSFYINTMSMSRFAPVISRNKTEGWCKSFLRGYFTDYADNNERITDFIWFFILMHSLGCIGDRDSFAVYKNVKCIKSYMSDWFKPFVLNVTIKKVENTK